jgi:hypothetical protein
VESFSEKEAESLWTTRLEVVDQSGSTELEDLEVHPVLSLSQIFEACV